MSADWRSSTSVREHVLGTITGVADEQKRSLATLSDDLLLVNSGLDSLSLAVIVARLDAELGVDPFAIGDATVMPTTIGAFVILYEKAVNGARG